MARKLRERNPVNYAEDTADIGALLKFTHSGIDNAKRGRSLAKATARRKSDEAEEYAEGHIPRQTARQAKDGQALRHLPSRAGRVMKSLKEVSESGGSGDLSTSSDSESGSGRRVSGRHAAAAAGTRQTRSKAFKAGSNGHSSDKDMSDAGSGDDQPAAAPRSSRGKALMDESDDDSEEPESDDYEPPPTAVARRHQRDTLISPSDVEGDESSESAGSASDDASEESYGGRKRRRAVRRPQEGERRSSRLKDVPEVNLHEDALAMDVDQSSDSQGASAEASAEASEQDEGKEESMQLEQTDGNAADDEVQMVRSTRSSARQAAQAKSRRRSSSKGAQQKLHPVQKARVSEQLLQPSKPKQFRAAMVEKILDWRKGQSDDGVGEELYVKMKGEAYRRARWQPFDKVMAGKPQLVRNFMQRRLSEPPDEDLVNGVHQDWQVVERIIAQRVTVGRQEYLVKHDAAKVAQNLFAANCRWCGLGYTEATWEAAGDLADDQDHIERFVAREKPPKSEVEDMPSLEAVPDFQNGRALRDYQKTSLHWMMANCVAERNCILGDEMGLGKTAQSIAALQFQLQLCGRHGPFLVIAPLTTLGHWQREIEAWTTMNVVLYAGTAADREVIEQYEWDYNCDTSSKKSSKKTVPKRYKFNVLLTSYETVRQERSLFKSVSWTTVIIDEAHRLKSTKGATRKAIEDMQIGWLLLLTGTPVQNNMKEVQGVLSMLDTRQFGKLEDFTKKYGGDDEPPTVAQIQALQQALQPILLRRMKEDVESLPEKEEVVVWVELTHQQRSYYKALYANQIGSLLVGAGKALPNLRNLAVELRKVCCHPFLCNGLEDDMTFRQLQAGVKATELDSLINASGKMVLLFKLLPKLRSEGKKVLIFSQFKIMLNVIEDALRLARMPLERIDGSVSSRERQAAIDRFTEDNDDAFVFLLSTKAGGQGITLTAADTVIIYDSDWNPQNDLQAMARCHRIGQHKDVIIYRLVCRDTYEAQVFQTSSRKYGLDEAILGNLGGSDPEKDGKRITELLKFGAHSIMGQDEAKARDGESFVKEDINAILAGRTEKRQIGSRAGNTFSTATFTVQEGNKDAQSFWGGLMPDALAQYHEEQRKAAMPSPLQPRQRKAVKYSENTPSKTLDDHDNDGSATMESSSSDGSSSSGSDLEPEQGDRHGRGKPRKEKAPQVKQWPKHDLKALEDRLMCLGDNHDSNLAAQASIGGRSSEDVEEVKAYLLQLLKHAHEVVTAAQRRRSEEQHQLIMLGDEEALTRLLSSGHEANKAAPGLLHSLADPPPKQACKAFEASEVLQRLAKNAAKYLGQLKERRELNTFMTSYYNHDEAALDRMRTMLNALERWAFEWTREDDKQVLKLAHRLGYASWMARRCAETLLAHLDQGSADRLKSLAWHHGATKLQVLDEQPQEEQCHKMQCDLISKRVKQIMDVMRRTARSCHPSMHGPARTSHSMSESSDSEEDTPPPAEPVSHAGQHHVPSASRPSAHRPQLPQRPGSSHAGPTQTGAAPAHKHGNSGHTATFGPALADERHTQPPNPKPHAPSHLQAPPSHRPYSQPPEAARPAPPVSRPAVQHPQPPTHLQREKSPDTIFSDHMGRLSVHETGGSASSDEDVTRVRKPALVGANKAGRHEGVGKHQRLGHAYPSGPSGKASGSAAGLAAMDVDSSDEVTVVGVQAQAGKENFKRPTSAGYERSGSLPTKRKEGHNKKLMKQSTLMFTKKAKPASGI